MNKLLISGMCVSVLCSGCTLQAVKEFPHTVRTMPAKVKALLPEMEKSAPEDQSVRKPVEVRQLRLLEEQDKEPKRFGLNTLALGSRIQPKQGVAFEPATVAADRAIIYVYRLNNADGKQEWTGPNLYVNETRIPSLQTNHYYWIDVPPGDYQLRANRSLGVVHIQKPYVVNLNVEAGQSYYLKYEDLKQPRSLVSITTMPYQSRLTIMTADKALTELQRTQQKTQNILFGIRKD